MESLVDTGCGTLHSQQMAGYTASERARLRVKEEMARKEITQTDIAGMVNWSQSRVSKNLNARIELGLDDLETLCFAIGIPLTEVVRDPGMEFVAEMTPTELKIHQRIRLLPTDVQTAVMKVLNITQAEARRAMPKPQRKKLA